MSFFSDDSCWCEFRMIGIPMLCTKLTSSMKLQVLFNGSPVNDGSSCPLSCFAVVTQSMATSPPPMTMTFSKKPAALVFVLASYSQWQSYHSFQVFLQYINHLFDFAGDHSTNTAYIIILFKFLLCCINSFVELKFNAAFRWSGYQNLPLPEEVWSGWFHMGKNWRLALSLRFIDRHRISFSKLTVLHDKDAGPAPTHVPFFFLRLCSF